MAKDLKVGDFGGIGMGGAGRRAAKANKVVKTLAEPKSAVRVKPPAKTKPNKPDVAKTNFKNDSSRNRASDRAYKRIEAETKKYKVEERTGYEHQYASDAAELAGINAKLKRKPNLEIKTSSGKPDVRKPARVPDKRATKTKVINSGKNFTATRINIYRPKPVIKKKSK